MTDARELVSEIVSAYVSQNRISLTELPGFINSVYSALQSLDAPLADPAPQPVQKATPAQIRKSITQDALISFIDGRPYKVLKRHLTINGLTSDAYRAMYGLPGDYPLVAASYRAMRSAYAISTGLGQFGRSQASPQEDSAPLAAVDAGFESVVAETSTFERREAPNSEIKDPTDA
jgi:predicted transcriptional regulator